MAIPESIKKLANDIRTKIYGKEVREALAKGIEEAGDLADKANTKSENAVYQVNNIQAQVNQLVVEGDSSVEAAQARVGADGEVYETLKERLDTEHNKINDRLTQATQDIDSLAENKADRIELENVSLRVELAKLNSLYLSKFYKKMQNADTAPIGNDVVVACQGDSMTAGNGSTEGNSYPEQLRYQLQKIARPGQTITVINRGVVGDSTKQSLDRWAEPSGADLCIIYLGTNDFNRNISMEEFSSSYEAIIQKEIKNGTAVILVTPHKWRNANWMVKANNGSIGDYVAVIKDFGRQYNAPVFDLHAESRNLDYTAYANEQDPGIHFSDIGYKNLAVKLAAFLGFHHPLTLPKLKNGDFLGVRPSIDGIKEPSGFDPFWYSASYPTPSEWNSEGIGIAVGEEERIIYYSFYAEEDNLALIPSFFFTATDGSEKFEMVINDNCMPYHPNNRYQYGSEIVRTLPPTSLSLKMSGFPSGNPVETTTQNFFLNPRSYYYRYLPTKGWYVIQLRLKNIRLHGFDVLNMVQMTNYRNIYLMQNS
jgi:lysophospholipase L1-like esterase